MFSIIYTWLQNMRSQYIPDLAVFYFYLFANLH